MSQLLMYQRVRLCANLLWFDLGQGVVALYTIVTDTRYTVVLVTPDTQVGRQYPIAAAELNQKVSQFREALQNPRVDPRPLAQELYKILVAPVAKDLDGAHAQTLMWSLDGALRYLPLAALHDGERYLVERYRNVMFTPASNARLKDKPRTAKNALGMGVAKAADGFSATPGVAEELHGLVRESGEEDQTGLFPGTVLLDDVFTAEAMQRELTRQYTIVHIASPFSPRAAKESDPFLRLGDGKALTIEQLKSWHATFKGTDLVTFSSCPLDTGEDKNAGRAVEGFSVLLQQMGAKAVLLPLWPVTDAGTREFMLSFYGLWENRNLSKAEALRQAQLALLHGEARGEVGETRRGFGTVRPVDGNNLGENTPRFTPDPQAPYAHPYYWAPFILIGNWL